MTDYGITDEGFVLKDFDTIIEEIEQDEYAVFGPAINVEPDDVLGQLNGVFGNRLSELWEVAQAVYRSLHPDWSSGEALDNVCAITGVIRLDALASAVDLEVNLAAGATLPAGSIASIGTTGDRWVTQSAVTNAAAVAATVDVEARSEEVAPIVGNAYAIDSIAVPVAGWSAKAAKNTLNSEPFTLANNQTLLVEIDEGSAQTVTFVTGDFVDITNATAAEVASVLSSNLTGASALDAAGEVRLTSDLEGSGSAVRITGGTGFEALGFSREKVRGFNIDKAAQIINTASETYALSDGETLFVKVDRGGTQTITFPTGDFVAIGAATAVEVAKSINSQISDAVAYEVLGKVQIESLDTGTNSFVEVTGGTANTALSFPLNEEEAGVPGAATIGRDIETDAELRLRREELLRITGAGTLEAIRAAVRAITDPDVLQAFVIENETDVTDGFGRPPHSFEVIVVGGDDQEIGQTIFDTKPIGINTYRVPGADGRTVQVTDSQGTVHDINFSRGNDIRMYTIIDVTVDQATFGGGNQAAGEQQVKEALKELGDNLQIGEDVIIMQFACAAIEVAGVVDVTSTKIEDTTPPTNTANIPIADRDYATFSTSDIVVNVTLA
jgi:hypothetical protein